MSQSTRTKRDGTPYTPRAKKLPKPSKKQTPEEKARCKAAHELYYLLDAMLDNGTFAADEYDRIVYATSLAPTTADIAKLLELIKKADYVNVIKPILDLFRIPEEPPAVVIEPVTDTFDPMDEDSSQSGWTDNPTYKGKEKDKLRKRDFVVDEAEESDNIDSGEDDEVAASMFERREKSEHDERKLSRENKLLALAKTIVKKHPEFHQLKSNICKNCDEGRTITKYRTDGLCGPCRNKKKQQSKRKYSSEIRVINKEMKEKQEEVVLRAELIKRKQKAQKNLEKLNEALGDSSDSEVESSSDSD